jgi:hypothetical protein
MVKLSSRFWKAAEGGESSFIINVGCSSHRLAVTVRPIVAIDQCTLLKTVHFDNGCASMAEIPIRMIYRKDSKRRVIMFQRSPGSFGEKTFGLEEQYCSDEPLEQCWCPLSQVPLSFGETEPIAVREARALVVGLAEDETVSGKRPGSFQLPETRSTERG